MTNIMFWLLVALSAVMIVILIMAVVGNKVYDVVHKIAKRFDGNAAEESDDSTED